MESVMYPIIQAGNLFHLHHTVTLVQPDSDFRFHYHTFFEIYLLINGSCDFMVENTIYHLNQYDIMIVPPYKFHTPIPKPGTILERMVLNIFPSFYKRLHCENYIQILQYFADNNPKLHSFTTHRNNIIEIFDYIDKRFNNNYTTLEPIINFKIVELLYMLYSLSKSDKYNPGTQSIKKESNVTQEVIRFVNENFRGISRVEHVAANFHYSKNHLSSIFKRDTGITIAKYINIKKIENVEKLHKKGVSLSDASIQSGFSNYRQFAYEYKQEFGVSPKNGLNGQ